MSSAASLNLGRSQNGLSGNGLKYNEKGNNERYEYLEKKIKDKTCFRFKILYKPFPKQALVFTCLQYKSFENTEEKGEIAPFPTVFSIHLENFPSSSSNLTLPKRQILDSSKQNEFAEDNFKVHVNDLNFSKRVESTVGKGENATYEQFLLFSQFFQKTCTTDT